MLKDLSNHVIFSDEKISKQLIRVQGLTEQKRPIIYSNRFEDGAFCYQVLWKREQSTKFLEPHSYVVWFLQ